MATQRPVPVQDAERPNPFAALEKYDPKKYNVLCPPAAMRAELGFGYAVSVEVVHISPRKEDKHVYKVGSRPHGDGWEDEVTFYGTTLNRIANAAGISILGTRRTDDRRDPDYVEFQATGALIKSDGTPVYRTRTNGLDLKEIEEEVTEQQTIKVRTLIKENKVNKNDETAAIGTRVRAEMHQKRKKRVPLCETGAILRVFRELIGMNSSYPISDLDKDFVIARIDFRPDASDPVVKRMLMERGLNAGREIFGSQGMLPTGSRVEIAEVAAVDEEPSAETVNGNTEGAQTPEQSEEEKVAHHVADLKLMEASHQIGYLSELQTRKGLKQKMGVDLTKLGAVKRLEIILALEKLPDKAAEPTGSQGGLGELFEGVE